MHCAGLNTGIYGSHQMYELSAGNFLEELFVHCHGRLLKFECGKRRSVAPGEAESLRLFKE